MAGGCDDYNVCIWVRCRGNETFLAKMQSPGRQTIFVDPCFGLDRNKVGFVSGDLAREEVKFCARGERDNCKSIRMLSNDVERLSTNRTGRAQYRNA
jgi:hypothetical protein